MKLNWLRNKYLAVLTSGLLITMWFFPLSMMTLDLMNALLMMGIDSPLPYNAVVMSFCMLVGAGVLASRRICTSNIEFKSDYNYKEIAGILIGLVITGLIFFKLAVKIITAVHFLLSEVLYLHPSTLLASMLFWFTVAILLGVLAWLVELFIYRPVLIIVDKLSRK